MARRVGRRAGSAGGRGVGAACAHTRRESEAHLSPSYPAGPFAIPIQPSRPALVGLRQATRGMRGACSGRMTRPRRCACGGCALPWAHARRVERDTSSREDAPLAWLAPGGGAPGPPSQVASCKSAARAARSAWESTCGKMEPPVPKERTKKTHLASERSNGDCARRFALPLFTCPSPPALSRPPSPLNIP